ncbi:serine hydrolase [Tessaracoccus sp. G1721]
MPGVRTRPGALIVAVLIPVALGAAACAPEPAPPAGWSPSVGGNGNPGTDAVGTVTRERVDAAVEALPALISTVMDASGVPGLAVSVVYDGETLFAEGYGVRSMDTEEPVDADTVFQLASVSKSVGATVVAREVGRGTVAWDTPLVEHLSGFELEEPWVTGHVTIADMYSHRSGLYGHAGDELEDLGYGRDEVLDRLRLTPLAPFRAEENYTNFGLTAAAEAVATAAGTDWAALSERDLYQPLGMTSTSSRFDDFVARENRAVGHVPVDGAWQVTTMQRQPDAQSPAGGVSSTVVDMASWMELVLTGGVHDGDRIVAEDALVPAITGQFVSKPAHSSAARGGLSGYGFNVGTTAGGLPSISHSGAFALGTGTAFTMLPGQGLGIIVLTNGSPVGAAEAVVAHFLDLAQFGEARQDWWTLANAMLAPLMDPMGGLAGQSAPSDPAAARPLVDYVGVYDNEYFGAATVTLAGDGLQLSLGPEGAVTWPLTHWDGDVFTYEPYNENAPPGTVGQATFDGGNLVLELLDTHGLGTFTRTPSPNPGTQ